MYSQTSAWFVVLFCMLLFMFSCFDTVAIFVLTLSCLGLSSFLCVTFSVIFTARCTLVQSAVLQSHVVCPSVRPSVTLVNCDHISWNSSKIISLLVSLGRLLFATPTWRVCSKGNTLNLGPKSPTPCWFECLRHSVANCGRMVTQIAQRSQWRAIGNYHRSF